MIETSTGLVLRLRPLTETSLIVHWLTPTLGRIATVAKGARRAKSPFRGRLDLFYLADFSFTRSRSSELHTLREVQTRETHEFLRRNLGYLHQVAYCVRLIELATETETPLTAVYELTRGLLEALPRQPPTDKFIFAFELKLLEEMGLRPELSQARLSDGTKAVIGALEKGDWAHVAQLRLSPAQQSELRQFLHGFLSFNLGRVPKGREAALGSVIEKYLRG